MSTIVGSRNANAFLVRDNAPDGIIITTENASAYPAAVAGYATTTLTHGVYGYSTRGGGRGVVGVGGTNAIGVVAQGGKANMILTPAGTPAPSRMDTHARGEIVLDEDGNLWLCTRDSFPGVGAGWRKMSGPSTSGAFHAVGPARVYDSRWSDGKLLPNQSRVVSVANARDLSSGAVSIANFVPEGATAVVGNITIAGTNGGAGALAVARGDAETYAASTTCPLFSRQLKVFCLGAGTHFIIDISGYYR